MTTINNLTIEQMREAFERHQADLTGTDYKELKAHFDNNEQYFSSRYNEGSLYERDWLVWEACWQSRQAEIDQAYADIETFAQAHQRECDIKVQIANELKEKDKRIEEVLFVIARAKDGYYGYSNDGGDTDNLVFDFEKALGGNNANS